MKKKKYLKKQNGFLMKLISWRKILAKVNIVEINTNDREVDVEEFKDSITRPKIKTTGQ